MKAVSAWREGRSSSSAQLSRDKVQALVTSLEAEYTAQTIALQERHAMAVSSLTAVRNPLVLRMIFSYLVGRDIFLPCGSSMHRHRRKQIH